LNGVNLVLDIVHLTDSAWVTTTVESDVYYIGIHDSFQCVEVDAFDSYINAKEFYFKVDNFKTIPHTLFSGLTNLESIKLSIVGTTGGLEDLPQQLFQGFQNFY
jgi:hypothetical protein